MDSVALTSIIMSGFVVIIVSLSSLLVPAITEGLKWKREREAARADAIDRVTHELLGHLSHFSAWDPAASAKADWGYSVYSELVSSYFAWEHTLWSGWNDSQRESAKLLREQMEILDPSGLRENLPRIADTILNLAHAAD